MSFSLAATVLLFEAIAILRSSRGIFAASQEKWEPWKVQCAVPKMRLRFAFDLTLSLAIIVLRK